MIKVYDTQFKLQAILENAYDIGYEKRMNELHTASFSLPLDDEKTAYCQSRYFVEVFEDDEMTERVDLFRIMPNRAFKNESTNSITYECEHVLATLMDDIIFRDDYTIGFTTENTLKYIVEKQTTKHWKLGRVDFTRYFHYKWENETLLRALFSIPRPFDVAYQWTWDTTKYPWTLNLIEPPTQAEIEIRYGHNMKEIEREEEPNDLVNRIYPLGYGEGVNQLDITNVHPDGLPYIEDEESIQKYGLVARPWIDRRFEDDESLYNTAKAMLKDLSIPRVSYKVSAADLSKLTDYPISKFYNGMIVRIIDDDFGTFDARIVVNSKADVKGAPGDIDIEIANKKKDIAGTIADLNDRQRVNESYAQGATNLDSRDYVGNADPHYPAVIRFFVPEEAVKINKLKLNYLVDKFRAHSRATKGGGAIATSVTSSAGGGTTATSTSGGAHRHEVFRFNSNNPPTLTKRQYFAHTNADFATSVNLETAEQVNLLTFEEAGAHSHSVSIPNHTHDLSIELPNHTHDIEYGIFEGPQATALEVEVDGNKIEGLGVNEDGIDIIPYLATDSQGKITRGAWHEVKITPNSLTRIEASIYMQFFIKSRGGTDA